LDKKEALKLAIDGYKIKNKNWNTDHYIYFNGKQFIFVGLYESLADDALNYEDNWEIIREPKFKRGQFVADTYGDYLKVFDYEFCMSECIYYCACIYGTKNRDACIKRFENQLKEVD
jgi:hypothetical protein